MDKDEIRFDVLKIDSEIKKSDTFQEDDIKFQFCKEYSQDQHEQDEQIDFPKYIAKIRSKSIKYLGILSKNLKKESYGYNCYENGDEYFGQWNKDKKEGYGIYYFKESSGDGIKDIYVGEFKNNAKSGEGIYFHISKSEQESEILVPVDFSLAIGNFIDDNFVKGIIFTRKNGKNKLYKGKIDGEGKKEDDNAELFEDDDKVFHGIFNKNNMVEGRIVLTKDGKKENGYYFQKKGEDDVDFNYEKEGNDDDKLVNQLNEYNAAFQYEKIKDLFIDIMTIKLKISSYNDFDYMKNLNYDLDIKQKLKDQYGKYLYF